MLTFSLSLSSIQATTLPFFPSKIHKLYCYLASEDPFATPQPNPFTQRWFFSALSHKHPGGHSWAALSHDIPFFSFLPIKCTSTWRRGWEHASSLKHPVLTPDCKDHESSPPPRTSAVCTATGIHKTLALYANRWGHQPTWAQSAEKQSYLFPVHGNTRTSYQHPLRTWFPKILGYLTTSLGNTSPVFFAAISGIQMLKQQACTVELNSMFSMATARN